MANELFFEKRGCDFKDYNPEKKTSNLENFRLYAQTEFLAEYGRYFIEVITHHFEQGTHPKDKVGTWTWIEMSYTTLDGIKIDLRKCAWVKPFKHEVINHINSVLGTKYSVLKFKEEK